MGCCTLKKGKKVQAYNSQVSDGCHSIKNINRSEQPPLRQEDHFCQQNQQLNPSHHEIEQNQKDQSEQPLQQEQIPHNGQNMFDENVQAEETFIEMLHENLKKQKEQEQDRQNDVEEEYAIKYQSLIKDTTGQATQKELQQSSLSMVKQQNSNLIVSSIKVGNFVNYPKQEDVFSELEKVSSNRDLKAAGVEEKASDNEFNFDD